MMNSVNYTDPEFLAQWAREVMGHVNYGEMSERQVAEFVADASKEAPEWMKAMAADIEVTTEMRNLVVENRALLKRMELLDKHVADTLKLTANTMRKNPAREKALSGIALQVQQWLDWQERERGEEGIPCNDDTYMMHVPVWPTRGQLKAWIAALKTPEQKS